MVSLLEMDDQRCLHCRRKIHPALRPDAKFCGRSRKSSYHRDRKVTPPELSRLAQCDRPQTGQRDREKWGGCAEIDPDFHAAALGPGNVIGH